MLEEESSVLPGPSEASGGVRDGEAAPYDPYNSMANALSTPEQIAAWYARPENSLQAADLDSLTPEQRSSLGTLLLRAAENFPYR